MVPALLEPENQAWYSYRAQTALQRKKGGQAQGIMGSTAFLRLLPGHLCALWHGDSGGGHRELSTSPGAAAGTSTADAT